MTSWLPISPMGKPDDLLRDHLARVMAEVLPLTGSGRRLCGARRRRALRAVAAAHARRGGAAEGGRRVLRLLEERGALPAQGPENALQAYRAHSLQQRLHWTQVDVRPPPRKQPRCAVLEGFSLHANTHLNESDRQGLERLCRYGARVPRRLRSGRETAATSGPPNRREGGERNAPPSRRGGRERRAPGNGQQGGAEGEGAASGLGGVAQEDGRLQRVRVLGVCRQAAGAGVREGSGRGARDSGAPGLAYGRCAPGPGARAPQAAWC
jgi:hypothetical protein